MLSSLHIQNPSSLVKTISQTPVKRRNLKNKSYEALESKQSLKGVDLRCTPVSNKYESTNSTSNCDDEELRIHCKGKERLRLKLKRKAHFNNDDEYAAALCLISIKRKYRPSSSQVEPKEAVD
jgi:hypothetical protein